MNVARARSSAALAAPFLLTLLFASTPALAADPVPPPPTSAQPTQAQLGEARGHFNRGVKFYKDADYRSALVEFQEAYRVAPNARILFNIGQTHDELQDFAGAVKAFRDYLAGGGATITKVRRAEVEKDLRRLEAHVATVEIAVSEAGADVVAEGDRRIDLGKSPLSAPALLNGGTWTIVASKAGFERVEEHLTAAGGDAKMVALKMTPAQEPGPAVVPVPVVAVAPPPPAPPPTRSLTPVWIGLALTGALAAGAGVTGVLTLGAKRDYDREVARLPGDAGAVASARALHGRAGRCGHRVGRGHAHPLRERDRRRASRVDRRQRTAAPDTNAVRRPLERRRRRDVLRNPRTCARARAPFRDSGTRPERRASSRDRARAAALP
jgi:hypothetical protein